MQKTPHQMQITFRTLHNSKRLGPFLGFGFNFCGKQDEYLKADKGPSTIPFSAKYWKIYIIFRRECYHDARWPQKPRGGMRKSHHQDFMMMMMSWLLLRGKNMDFLRLDSMTDEKWMADRHKI